MSLTNFPNGVSSFGIPVFGDAANRPPAGNVYWVKKTTDTNYAEWYSDHETVYSDGTKSIYTSIQAAVDVAKDGRCDIVYVHPGKWTEEVYVVAKRGLRIIGLGNGLGATENGAVRIRPSDATTHYAFTSKIGTACSGAAFHVLSRAVEISGFYLDGGGGYAGIYAGGGLNGGITGYTTENASGCWFHNNMIRGGSEGPIGIYLNGVRFVALVENNIFERWTGAAIEMDAGNASNEGCIIRNNQFIADNAAYGIDIYGEANSSLGCQINHNVFGDRVSHAFTMAVNIRTGSTGCTIVAGNNFACNHPMVLTTADWVSGNTYGRAGSATEDSNYAIQETTAGA